MRRWLGVVGAVSLVLALGCGDEKKKDNKDASKDSAGKGSAAASAAPGAAGSGSAAAAPAANADVDPKVLEELKKVLKCPWESGRAKWDCEELKAWDKWDGVKDGKADKSLVALLSDKDTKIVVTAANALYSHGQTYREDKAMVETILKKVEAGPDEDLTVTLARVVSRAKTDKLGFSDRIIALMKSHKSKRVRGEVIRGAQFTDSEKYFETTKEMCKDPDVDVRYDAMGSFWVGTPSGKEKDVCDIWYGMTKDADEKIWSEAFYLALFTSKGCDAHFDEMIKDIDGKVKAGDLKNSAAIRGLEFFMTNSKASDKQKGDALKILKAVAENGKNNWMARTSAIRGIGRDPKNKAYLGKFKTEKDDFVKKEAERVIEQIEKDEKKGDAKKK